MGPCGGAFWGYCLIAAGLFYTFRPIYCLDLMFDPVCTVITSLGKTELVILVFICL